MALRGPAGGYINGPKNQYRRDVWAFVEAVCEVPRRDRRVLILDTRQGREVEELLRRGYSSSLIHVVNENAADVALLQLRYRGDPRMRGAFCTHGVALRRALASLAGLGVPLDVVNLDFCSCLSDDVGADLHAAAGLLRPGGVIAVNVQRGRELLPDLRVAVRTCRDDPAAVAQWINQHGEAETRAIDARDQMRLSWLGAAIGAEAYGADGLITGCRWHARRERWGVYRSAGAKVTMLWYAAQVLAHADAAERERGVMNRAIAAGQGRGTAIGLVMGMRLYWAPCWVAFAAQDAVARADLGGRLARSEAQFPATAAALFGPRAG